MSSKIKSAAPVLDCGNLACPEPVLRCRTACENDTDLQGFVIIVDNQAAKENVTRFLNSRQYKPQVKLEGGKWIIQADRQINPLAPSGQANKDDVAAAGIIAGQAEARRQPNERSERFSTVLLLTSEFMGQGDDALGGKLMLNFLKTLSTLARELWRIVMLNGGVRLAAQGHPALPDLRALEAAGVEILVCGTCLEYFGLLDKKQVGQTTNMLDVATSLQLAGKIIRP